MQCQSSSAHPAPDTVTRDGPSPENCPCNPGGSCRAQLLHRADGLHGGQGQGTRNRDRSFVWFLEVFIPRKGQGGITETWACRGL